MSCHPLMLPVLRSRFPIPMRGNEYQFGVLDPRPNAEFPIPMRGNETLEE